ncbi:UDP-N-acetylmuramoyl-tripeptide--D-alanyl-D-alanine ligase [Kibdelosporangium lantanae]
MIPLTAAQIAEAVHGRLHLADGTELVTGPVEFDSRQVTPDGVFVALPGVKVDGHDFAATAGARITLAAREVDAPSVIVPPATDAHSRSFALIGDKDGSGAAVLAGLAAMARYVVDRLPNLTVVGVTGSSGKTSTKDLIAQLLAPMGATVAPPGSFNSELGHPYTVLRASEQTKYLVLELSARGPGHIAALCEVAPPKIGVVINVGTAHIGEFGSREEIARTKGELVEALPEDGVAILNADDPLVRAMASRTKARVVLVGEAADADIRAVDVTLDAAARASFRLVTPQGEADVTLALHGAHQVGNSLSAAAVALELGATPAEVAERLSNAQRVSAYRMEVTTRPDGVTVVNDSYNANPESVQAALKSLAEMGRSGRRTWAVLGQMADLGDEATRAHDEIGRLAVRLDVNRLVVVGEKAKAMHQGAHLEGSWGEESVYVPDVDTAVAHLRAHVEPGDVVLTKASKSEALWRVAEALLEDAK